MISLNPVGIAANLTPGDKGTDGTYTVDVLLMKGTIPEVSALESIASQNDFVTLYPDVVKKFTALSITTAFNANIQERTFRKTPVDALPFTNDIDGDIGWAVIVFPGEKIMFTDSIGTWDETDKAITLNVVGGGLTGTENVLKDINIVVRDKSTYELNPNGIFA